MTVRPVARPRLLVVRLVSGVVMPTGPRNEIVPPVLTVKPESPSVEKRVNRPPETDRATLEGR